MHRFRQSNETKFGAKPPQHRLNSETIEKSIETALPLEMKKSVAIWEFLGITEEEYYAQYHKQPVSDNALELQKSITDETPQEEENVVIENTEILENNTS